MGAIAGQASLPPTWAARQRRSTVSRVGNHEREYRMEYSSIFVCLMGMGTVFFGLICLIALTYHERRGGPRGKAARHRSRLRPRPPVR